MVVPQAPACAVVRRLRRCDIPGDRMPKPSRYGSGDRSGSSTQSEPPEMIAKSIATIALLLLPSALFCQSHFNESAMSPEVLVIIGRLARHNALTSSFVGIMGGVRR